MILLGLISLAPDRREPELEEFAESPSEVQEDEQADEFAALLQACRSRDAEAETAAAKLTAQLPSLSGDQHGEYAFQLYSIYEGKDELSKAEALLLSSLAREEVRASPYFDYLLYALARTRRLTGDYVGALDALQDLREHLPQIEYEPSRVQLNDYEAMCRTLLNLDLGLISAARRSLARHSAFQQEGIRASNVISTEVQLELERGRSGSAVQILQDFLQQEELEESLVHDLRALLGRSLIDTGDLEGGLAEIEESLSQGALAATTEALARRAGALAHLELGNFAAASAILEPLASRSLPALNVAGCAAVRWRIAHESNAPSAEQATRLRELRSAFRGFLKVWQELPIIEGGTGFFVPRRRRVLMEDVIRAELSQPGAPEQLAEVALQQVLDAQSCGQLARQLGGHALSVAHLKTRLSSQGGGVLVFLPVTDSTLVFIVDQGGVSIEEVPGRQTLRQIVQAAERDQKDRTMPISDFAKAMNEFTTAIFPANVRSKVEAWETVRFDGLDLITTLPPTLLRTTNEAWLGCDRAVVVWPSCTVAHQLEKRRTADSDPASLLALLDPDPVPSRVGETIPDLARLPFDERELRNIEEMEASSNSVETRLGRSATLQSVADLQPRWLWIHAHGVMDQSRERAAGLVLSSSSDRRTSIWPPDVEQRLSDAWGPDLVFLGACQAGAGGRRLGDDQGNPLGAAFMVGGAESVILATTDLRHQPTKRLAMTYWSAFIEGASPAEALRLARVALRDAGEDPREFAALNLVGLN